MGIFSKDLKYQILSVLAFGSVILPGSEISDDLCVCTCVLEVAAGQ